LLPNSHPASSYPASFAHECLAKNNVTSFFSPALKMALKGMIFNDVTTIQAKSEYALATFQTIHFTKCFKWWHNHWAHGVKSQKHYTERNKIH
jgi:hypothetical protein